MKAYQESRGISLLIFTLGISGHRHALAALRPPPRKTQVVPNEQKAGRLGILEKSKTSWPSWESNPNPSLVTIPITLSLTVPEEMSWTRGYTLEHEAFQAIRKQTRFQQTTEIKQEGRRCFAYILVKYFGGLKCG